MKVDLLPDDQAALDILDGMVPSSTEDLGHMSLIEGYHADFGHVLLMVSAIGSSALVRNFEHGHTHPVAY